MPDINAVLDERGATYGAFKNHAAIAQQLKRTIQESPSYPNATASQREALDMILHKIARIVNGDPDYLDSWVDIIGYAQLVVEELDTKNRKGK